MASTLEIRTLGPRQWRVRGRDWTPRSRHAERLLLFLAVHPGQHRRAELASLLFSEADRTHALTYLRQALQRLREARPRLELAVDAERIGLSPSQPLWLDYAELLRAREDDPQDCRQAIALYRGTFLEPEGPESAPPEWWGWVCDRRREAETKLHACFDGLLQSLSPDDPSRRWELLADWMRRQPLQDRPHHEAIAFLARQGRLSEALHLYAQYEERRVVVLGRKPGPALQALRDRLQAERSLPSTSHPLPTWSPAPDQLAQRRFITVLAIALDAEKEQISDLSIEAHLHQCLGIAQQVGERYGGRVRADSDGIVEIVFGLDPFPQDGPLHAVQAALLLRRWSPPGHFPRLGIHSGRALVGAQGQLWGTLPSVARAAAWANHQRRGVVLTEAALHVLARAEATLPGSPLPPVRVHGEAILLYWLEDLPPTTAPPSTYPLIGRQREYERIGSSAAEVRSGGPGRLLWILGDPGMGKTHLLRHVAQDLSRQMLVVSYACQPLYRDSFLHPVAALTEQVFGLDRSQPEAARERIREQLLALGERDPLVHRLWWRWLRLEDDDPETGFLQQYRTVLFDSILDMLGSQLFPQARTLVVEDFHWADPGSFELLRRYLTFLHEKPVLMLISSRERLPLLEGVARHEGWISLAPWDAPTTHAFLRSLPDWHGTPEQASALYERTGGIPLYVEQLARWAEAAGQSTMPGSIQAILDGQIARAAEATDLLHTAAVLGTPFPLALLQQLVPWRDPETLEAEAGRLVERGLWQRLGDRWAFRHELLREAVYRSLPEGSLQGLHRRVAETLESLGERHPERLAHHFAAAGATVRAAEYRLLAARRDLGFEQFETAEAGFAAVIAWLTPQGPSPLLTQALAGLYRIRAVRQGYAARETRTALTALEIQCAPGSGLSGGERLVAHYGRWMVDAGQYGAHAADRRARRIAATEYPGVSPAVSRGIAEYTLGWSRFWLGDLKRAKAHLERAVASWQESEADTVAWLTCERYREAAIAYASMIDVLEGRVRDGYRRSAQAVEDLEGTPYQNSRLFLQCMRMSMGFWSGEAERSLAIAQEVVRESTMQGLVLWGIFARAVAAWAAVRTGRLRPRRGHARIRRALREIRGVWRFGAGFVYLLDLDTAAHAPGALRPAVGCAHAHLQRHGIRLFRPELQRWRPGRRARRRPRWRRCAAIRCNRRKNRR